jgi:hypothetical protein
MENGESKQREATTEEIEYIESAQAEALASKKIEQNEILIKENAKLALLEKLGITADEAKLLLT